MLADKIHYATKGGFLDKAKVAVEKLLSDDGIGIGHSRALWTWRTYDFIIDYYLAQGDLENAEKICNLFLDEMPYDEHGYYQKAEIQKKLHPGKKGLSEAIKTLKGALDNGVNAPACAQGLANIFLNQGEYENAIDFASRAIREAAQDQPHIGNAIIFAKRGFAYDRLFLKKESECNPNYDLAINALRDYQMALSLNKDGLGLLEPIYINQINFRISVLEKYNPNTSEEDTN